MVLAQLMALRAVEMPVVCAAHVAPLLVVAKTLPSDEAAKHTVALGQLTPNRGLPLGDGFCQLQVPPVVKTLGLDVEPDREPAGFGLVGDGLGGEGLVTTGLDAGTIARLGLDAATPWTACAVNNATAPSTLAARRNLLPFTRRGS